MANTYTPVYNFAMPAQGDLYWDDEISGNFVLLECAIRTLQTAYETHEHTAYATVTAYDTDSDGRVNYANSATVSTSASESAHADSASESTHADSASESTHATSATYSTHADSATYSISAAESTHADSASVSTHAISATYSINADNAVNSTYFGGKSTSDFVLRTNAAGTSINVATGYTIDFKVNNTTVAYVNAYGIIGSVYNADFAEGFVTSEKDMPLEGTVMIFSHDSAVVTSNSYGTHKFAGIVSYHPAVLVGMTDNWEKEFNENHKVPLAIVGQISTKVQAYNFNIYPGCSLIVDQGGRLTANNGTGHTVAQAMQSVENGTERVIKVLIR